MSSVFISYRRHDVADVAFAIADRLASRFSVFIDKDSIRAGTRYEELLKRELQSCDILLVIVGPRWLELARHRMGDSIDWVRTEIETAFEREGCRIIPVVVDGASLSEVGETDPNWLRRLRGLQHLSLRSGSSIRPDIDELCCRLGEYGEERSVTNSIWMKFITIAPTAGSSSMLVSADSSTLRSFAGPGTVSSTDFPAPSPPLTATVRFTWLSSVE